MEANTVSALTETLVNILLGIWSCVSIGFLISMIQNIVESRRQAKRDRDREARDIEYHEARMNEFK